MSEYFENFPEPPLGYFGEPLVNEHEIMAVRLRPGVPLEMDDPILKAPSVLSGARLEALELVGVVNHPDPERFNFYDLYIFRQVPTQPDTLTARLGSGFKSPVQPAEVWTWRMIEKHGRGELSTHLVVAHLEKVIIPFYPSGFPAISVGVEPAGTIRCEYIYPDPDPDDRINRLIVSFRQ